MVYFHPSDRPPLKNHLERWNGIMGDMQDFYRSEMERLGYGKVTLTLEKEEGKLKMHQVRGKSKDDGSYTYKSGGKIREGSASLKKKASIQPRDHSMSADFPRRREKVPSIPHTMAGANRSVESALRIWWFSVEGSNPIPPRPFFGEGTQGV